MEDEMRIREKFLLKPHEVQDLKNGLLAKLRVV